MSQKSGSDVVVYRRHAVEVGDIDRMLEYFLLLFEIVKSLLVNQLSQELNGWLGAVLFFYWHIQIVHEDNYFGNALGTNYMLATTLVQFSLYLLLHLRAGRPGTEHNLQESVLLVVHFKRIKIFDQSFFLSLILKKKQKLHNSILR